ncbi:MAG: tetratricopeptide repeat protein [Phycisphaerae bacterium]|nr:tetratricopeptide repeat protein [Phycisphaerae bacterium]
MHQSTTVLILAAGLTLVLSGCGSHGKYTAAHLSGAKLKMNALKAATEYQMAHQAFLAGDLNKALRHIDHSLSLNSDVVKSHVLKGRIFLEKNDPEKAEACFTYAQSEEPDNVEAAYFRGVLAERVSRKEEALAHYTKAADLAPTDAQYCIAAAEMMIDLGRVPDAKVYLEQREGGFVHNAGVKQVLGNIAMLTGDTARAEVLFTEARLLAPDDTIIRECLVRALMANQKYAEAGALLSAMNAEKPGGAGRDVMHLHATCLMHTDRPVEARELYLKLTKDAAGQSDAEAWMGLGQSAFILRDTARLKLAAQRLIAIAPQSADGYVLRGLLNRTNGEMQAALNNFQQAVKMSRTADNLMLLAMTQQDLGMTAQARQTLRAAAEVRPGDATAARMLATVPE